MKRPNQPSEPESCSYEGIGKGDLNSWTEQHGRSVDRDKREPQGGPASSLSNTAPKTIQAGGDGLWSPEPNTAEADKGEANVGQPGSKSVARAEGNARNWGRPESSRRTNYESQAGKIAQRQEERTDGDQGIGSPHSSQQQPRVTGAQAGQGGDVITQPTQVTNTARTAGKKWQTFLWAIAEKARKDQHHRFGDLYRWLNQDVLRLCFYELRKDAASGVDGVTYQGYEKNLEANLADLVGRLKRKGYRARLVRRKNIPKGNGKYRPLGIPALEDKLLQKAVAHILQAIYEEDFLKCSYGYRPLIGAHDAINDLTDELFWGRHNFITEADIKGFFDHIRWDWLERMLKERIQDGALLGLIRKWLRAGIMEEDGKVIHPEMGTPQGGIVSPVLANVYLHYVLDLWFERVVRKGNRGQSKLFRYADDFVACFEYRHEAEAFEKALKERLAKFGLEVAPEKTQTLRFGRNGGAHNGRFEFLGFEFRWEPSRKGKPIVKRRTAVKKWRAGVQRMKEWIKTSRHQKVGKLMKKLARKLQGTRNYYGIIGNSRMLRKFFSATHRAVFYWLNRRSQRRSYTWRAYNRLLARFQMPKPLLRKQKPSPEPNRTGSILDEYLPQGI